MIREIILGIMCVLFIIGYFKSCFSIEKEKWYNVYWIMLMTFLFGISMLLNFLFIDSNDDLRKKVENKCPEYEQITVYQLKKK